MYQDNICKAIDKLEDTQTEQILIGVVTNCEKLNVREAPSIDSSAICIIDGGSELVIDKTSSTNGFYKVCTADGVDGFCMKKFITLQM